MADLKISQLSAATALAGTEVLPVVQSGSTKKATVDQILAPASGKGLNFAAAGGDTLTMYDEGTWTPTITSSDNNVVVASYQFQQGTYTRIGRMVIASFKVATADVTSIGTGEARIGGLPFAVNASVPAAGAIGYVNNFVAGFNPSSVQAVPSTSTLSMMSTNNATNSSTPISTVNLTAGAVAFGNYIIGTICYEV